MPTSATNTYSGAVFLPIYDDPEAAAIPVKLAPSTVFAKGTLLGEVTATPGTYKPYASGNVDGSEVPKGFLQYDCATDASSNVTFGGAATGGQWGETAKVAPMWYTGAFKTSEMTGFDANAATKLGGHLINGSVADGVYSF